MKKCALIISFTPITDEPRVLRQAQTLAEQDWKIIAAGYKGRMVPPKDWHMITLPYESAPNGKFRNIKKLWQYLFYLPFIVIARYSDILARFAYWRSNQIRKNFRTVSHALRGMPDISPSLIIAHDYSTAPIAHLLSHHYGCHYVVDIHEYAKEQHNNRRIWRFIFKPWVDRMQALYLSKSIANTTVCDGIADLLAKDYYPMPRPIVVRSVPSYTQINFKKTEGTISVLYHGIIYPSRGLEMAIESLPLWESNFHLTIRGPADEGYLDQLKNQAQDIGVLERITFEKPVLFHEIIPAANRADIGYFIQPAFSVQKRFALPNKFFEYIAAGLALCINDLPEMSKITKEYDLGKIVDGYDAVSIAKTINSFTPEKIDFYKKNSLLAAEDLCWEKESGKMLEAYESIILQNRS